MTTTSIRPSQDGRDDVSSRRAGIAAILVPVFFIVSLVIGTVLYDLLGYKPENDDAPLWADLVAGIPTLIVFLLPCAAAWYYGRRAIHAGDRRGWLPAVVGAVAGIGMTVLTVVTLVNSA